jgi:hypothetical protein
VDSGELDYRAPDGHIGVRDHRRGGENLRTAKGSVMPKVINFDLMKEPMNWVTIMAMVLIGAFVAKLIVQWAKNQQSS